MEKRGKIYLSQHVLQGLLGDIILSEHIPSRSLEDMLRRDDVR